MTEDHFSSHSKNIINDKDEMQCSSKKYNNMEVEPELNTKSNKSKIHRRIINDKEEMDYSSEEDIDI